MSTISQALAAAFALVFTISLIAAQFASKYSPSAVEDFFDAATIRGAAVYVVAIVYPWVLLRLPWRHPVLDGVAIGLGTYCIAWTVRFFADSGKRATPAYRLNRLTTSVCRALHKADGYRAGTLGELSEMLEARPHLREIEDTIDNSLQTKDFSTLTVGVQSLLKCYVAASGGSEEPDLHARLSAFAARTSGDPRAVAAIVDAFDEVGSFYTWTRMPRQFEALCVLAADEIVRTFKCELRSPTDAVLLRDCVAFLCRLAGSADMWSTPATVKSLLKSVSRLGSQWASKGLEYPSYIPTAIWDALGGGHKRSASDEEDFAKTLWCVSARRFSHETADSSDTLTIMRRARDQWPATWESAYTAVTSEGFASLKSNEKELARRLHALATEQDPSTAQTRQ